jgi:DNA mismatch repair protein MutL
MPASHAPPSTDEDEQQSTPAPAGGQAGFGAAWMPAVGRAAPQPLPQGGSSLREAGQPTPVGKGDPSGSGSTTHPVVQPKRSGLSGMEPAGPAGPSPNAPPRTPPPALSGRVPALQVHNRYLVAESEEGVVVIDQHALHERILYEQLRAGLAGGGLAAQRLLIPEPVDLTAAEAAAVLESRDLLARLGLEVEHFGGDTLLVHSVPALLSGSHPGEMLHSVAECLLSRDRAPEGRDLVDGVLHQLACKAAVKAGDPLHPDEIAALLAQRHLAADAHHCPHGRPTALVLTRQELDRQFRRT